MKRAHYETNCGQYVLHLDGQPVSRPLDEVAIAYSLDPVEHLYSISRHGDPVNVRAWYDKQKATGPGLADYLGLIQGQYSLDALNRAVGHEAGNHLALRDLVINDQAIECEAVEVAESTPTGPRP